MKKATVIVILGTLIILLSVFAVILLVKDASRPEDPTQEAINALTVYTEEGFKLTYNQEENYYTFSSTGDFDGADLVIPAYYNGIPIKRFTTGLDELENIKSISVPDTIEEITIHKSDAPNLKFNEYESGYYVGNDDNPYYALVEYESDVAHQAVLHEDTKVIGNYAFNKQSYVTSVTIPEGVKSIGYAAFARCSSLTSLVIPDNVTHIGNSLFGHSEKLQSVVIGAGITELTDNMFISCKALKKIEIRGKITRIGSGAFHYCKSLDTFEIPQSVTEIESFAFAGCTALKSITMHKGIKTISRYVHFPETALYNEYLGGLYLGDDKNPYLYFIGLKNEDAESLVLHPDTYAVCQDVIPQVKTLTSLSIKGGWGKYLYSKNNCIIRKDGGVLLCGIKTSVIPSIGVKEIESYAFSNCRELESIVIPDSVKKMGRSVFYNCRSLVTVELGKNLEEIGASAFLQCHSLERISIPKSLRKISYNCFGSCRNLVEVSLTDKTDVIDQYAFANCSLLSSISLPGVKVIEVGAFLDCEALRKVTLSDDLGFIGDDAFMWCSLLEEISLPSGLRYIGDSAFKRCESLKHLNIPEGIESFGKTVYKQCASLESAFIPASREELYLDEFALCTGLKKIYLPSTLKQISGYGVIGSCESLEEIIFSGTLEQWNSLEKNDEWTVGSPAFKVICSDGEIEYPADERRYNNYEEMYW